MKLSYNQRQFVSHPKQALLTLETSITKSLERKEAIDMKAFSDKLLAIGDAFVSRSEVECLNKHGKRFAESLVKLGDNNLAGIVYSLIIRVNPKQATIVEQVATNALAIAKRQNDPIHIMARANDLKEIYKLKEPGSEKHLRTLQTEKHALKEICTNYEGVKNRYHSIRRVMRPIEAYELKLAAIKFEIAEILQKENKSAAITELLEAAEILEKHGKGRLSNEIENLLAQIKK